MSLSSQKSRVKVSAPIETGDKSLELRGCLRGASSPPLLRFLWGEPSHVCSWGEPPPSGGDLQPSQSESCVQERFFPWVKASLSQRLCEPSARWGVRVWPGVGRFLCSLRLALIFLSRFKGWPLSSCDFAHSQIHTQWKLHTRSATKKP